MPLCRSFWRNDPLDVHAEIGQTLSAINKGGEVHTLTEVQAFGGGIVPILNDLSGNTIIAPECLAPQVVFIPPGGKVSETLDEEGVELYGCCIHPWMRTTVTIKKKKA